MKQNTTACCWKLPHNGIKNLCQKSKALRRDRLVFESIKAALKPLVRPETTGLQPLSHEIVSKYFYVSKEKQHKIITIIWGTHASYIS